mgnify:CR=1 FL=1
MNIGELIHKNRPTLKESTINRYESQLNILKNMFDTETYDFLKNFDEVVDKLKDKNYLTARNYYNSIIVLLLALDEDKDLIEKYVELRDKLNEKYSDSQTDNISEKQSKNFASIEEVNLMLDTMMKEIKLKKLKSKGDLNGKEKELVMMYTMFSMLKFIPTRNDLSGMVLTTPSLYKYQSKEINYLVIGRNKMYYMLNQYKTNKTYGIDKKIDVPADLMKIVRMYLRATDKKTGDVLFTTSTGNPIIRNVMSQMLLKTSKKYMGKSVSSTMMRKIVVSDKFSDLKKEQVKYADMMGHSTATMDKIYIKDN